ncbi:PREDICTED: uncharacterized protein LOC108365774 [Rhagoletis zephyria]|uniref:uncharacterized protein LOC108365774 n=1 Tax=Rhagoletis zephyria TaxID=28612 RepID=UPI00081163D3|nr:PREDICTED: uncharacterized protein LOC108365774 [Rhagoletis zephyria]
MIDHKVLPLVYILAPKKTKKLYVKILQKLKEQKPELNPDVVVTDFELGFVNAVEGQFPDISVQGCYFHFTQCLISCLQTCGLKKRYGEDEKFALHIKMLMALAYVYHEDVVKVYQELVASSYYRKHSADLSTVLIYMTENWIGYEHRGTWRQPRFPIYLWNVYSAVLNQLARTNNAEEGWHNAFNRRVSAAHASIGKFIVALQAEQQLTQVMLDQHMAGRSIASKKRKTYRDLDTRLENVVARYESEGN